MFKVGDLVECFKLHYTFKAERLGQQATVLGFDYDGRNLILSEPFSPISSYNKNCFRLVNIDLENK